MSVNVASFIFVTLNLYECRNLTVSLADFAENGSIFNPDRDKQINSKAVDMCGSP